VSRACERGFLEYCRLLGFSAPKLVVVYNGIPVPEPCQPHAPKEPVQLLSIGNLQPHKGYHFLIDALAILNSRGKRVSLTVLGDGDLEYLARVWKQAEQAAVESQVHFLTAEMNTGSHIENSDIVVNPSVVENFSLAIGEAMAHAKPVVATDVGGTNELIVDGETGALVPPRDAEALAKAILAFIENSRFGHRCGEHARERIKENFSVEKQISQLEEIYLSILRSSESAGGNGPSEDLQHMYNLISEALISVNEKFHKMSLSIERLNQHVSNVEKDIRTLEAVVNNLLQKLPFRIYAKLKALIPKSRD